MVFRTRGKDKRQYTGSRGSWRNPHYFVQDSRVNASLRGPSINISHLTHPLSLCLIVTIDAGIEVLADQLGYSSSQIRRRFRQCFGMSPGAYRDKLRLEHAARLLVHTPQGIQEIARQSGYHNHSAFSRAFQRHYQCTPRLYRRIEQARQHESSDRSLQAFPVYLQHTGARDAVLTRLYQPSQALYTTAQWQQPPGIETLPERLSEATPIALLHDPLLASELPRVDIGVTVKPGEGNDLALPATFRRLQLPAQRCACLSLDDMTQLPMAVHYLIARSLPARGEYLNGEPPRLLKQTKGLELQLPIMDGNTRAN